MSKIFKKKNICGCTKNCKCVKSCEICNSTGMHYTIEHKCSKCKKFGHGHYECTSNFYECCKSNECKFMFKTLQVIFEFHTYNMLNNVCNNILYYYTDGYNIYTIHKDKYIKITHREFLGLYSINNFTNTYNGYSAEDVIMYLKNRRKSLHNNTWNEDNLIIFKLFCYNGM